MFAFINQSQAVQLTLKGNRGILQNLPPVKQYWFIFRFITVIIFGCADLANRLLPIVDREPEVHTV